MNLFRKQPEPKSQRPAFDEMRTVAAFTVRETAAALVETYPERFDHVSPGQWTGIRGYHGGVIAVVTTEDDK